jgi:pimeloyl-ACP methyl ester carboxylesterase
MRSAAEPRLVVANGVDLCVQAFGSEGDQAILLIGGAECSMDWWPDEFCERLAAGGRLVVRYDLRDTGQSVTYEPGAPQYTGSDLDDDAVGVLDALGIARAHLVGVSMGGGIAQQLAIDHPERVATLTLIAASPLGRDPAKQPLPPMTDELAASFAEPAPEPDWSDRAAVVDYIVERLHPFSGSVGFDEEDARALAERVFDRTKNIASSLKNHWLLDDGDPPGGRLADVRIPTLVLHGTDDPLFPPAHGEALAEGIRGARLVLLEGMGHEVPPRPLWDRVVTEILEHTRVN